MKKLSLLLISIFFCLLSAGNAMAVEPQTDVLDRNAVWTNNTDTNAKTDGTMSFGNENSTQVSTKSVKSKKMNGEVMEFDFIRETKSYDHSKDRGNSA
jgi:hypothetical protein